ncbi:hypothetical protein PPSQR21_008250 [Paenibacillus polymyxa SQR-21]|nr:hypothetical protein PPSQR21_008250 [Paenibacillus polymyxa SQR-21]
MKACSHKPSSSNAFTLVRTAGSRLRFLSLCVLVRTAGCLLRKFGRPHEHVVCDRKAVEHAFPSLLGRCGILCAAPPLVLLPHEGWCWKQRSGRNRSGEALALAFALGFQPLQIFQKSRGNSNRKNDPFAQRPLQAPTFLYSPNPNFLKIVSTFFKCQAGLNASSISSGLSTAVISGVASTISRNWRCSSHACIARGCTVS